MGDVQTEKNADSELPPTTVFELDWASREEQAEICERMIAHKRQTMNVRLMPSARLLRIRACDDGNRIVGWAGLDSEFTPGVAEVFSLFVVAEYRTYLVGVILETARAEYIMRQGMSRAFVRMESASNTSLIRYRISRRLMSKAANDIPDETAQLCSRCELYGNECTSQAFFWFDLEQLHTRGIERLGQLIKIESLPLRITLDPARFRSARRPLHPVLSEE
jgi:hypothetical protein